MVDFGAMKDKAQQFLAEHDDQVKGGIGKVGDFVGSKIGHDKVDGVENKLSEFIDKVAGNREGTPAASADPSDQATPPAAGATQAPSTTEASSTSQPSSTSEASSTSEPPSTSEQSSKTPPPAGP